MSAAAAKKPLMRQPYQIYEDTDGTHFVLTKEQVSGQVWFALRLQPVLSVVMLSQRNLSRLQLIGRAHLTA